MRQRYIWDRSARKGKGDWVPSEKYHAKRHAARLQVMGDIEPYRSVVTGEVVGGRRQHREHLKQHDLVEVGNEKIKPKPYTPAAPAANDIAEAFNMVRSGYRPPPDAYGDE